MRATSVDSLPFHSVTGILFNDPAFDGVAEQGGNPIEPRRASIASRAFKKELFHMLGGDVLD